MTRTPGSERGAAGDGRPYRHCSARRTYDWPVNPTASAKRYDWVKVQAFYDLGFSAAECQMRFVFSRCAISLELHHINGDGYDNRQENLQLLCPNCHSQTDTWGGRNKKRGSHVSN